MCHLGERETEYLTNICHSEEGDIDYSITMCHPREGKTTTGCVSTQHKDNNVFQAQNSSHLSNQDCVSYDQLDLESNVTFFSKRKDQQPVYDLTDTQEKVTLREVTPSHSKYQGTNDVLE